MSTIREHLDRAVAALEPLHDLDKDTCRACLVERHLECAFQILDAAETIDVAVDLSSLAPHRLVPDSPRASAE